MKTPLHRILQGLETYARPIIRQSFRADSCIASTRTIIRVLQSFGYKAVPLGVRVRIESPNFWKQAELDPPPHEGEPLAEWCVKYEAWSVGLGFHSTESGGWAKEAAHVIAVIPKERFLIDASLDQASRPKYNIHLPGCWIAPFGEGFMSAQSAVIYQINGSKVYYYGHPREKGYFKSDDWTDLTRTGDTYRKIVKIIKELS